MYAGTSLKDNLLDEMYKNDKNHPDIMKPFYNQGIGFTPDFEHFKDFVIDCIINQDYNNLYSVSDLTMEKNEFIKYIKESFGDDIENIYKVDKNLRGVGIEVLNQPTPLIGALEISAYIRKVIEKTMDLTDEISACIKTYKTSIYFSFKDNSYKLISVFHPLKETETL